MFSHAQVAVSQTWASAASRRRQWGNRTAARWPALSCRQGPASVRRASFLTVQPWVMRSGLAGSPACDPSGMSFSHADGRLLSWTPQKAPHVQRLRGAHALKALRAAPESFHACAAVPAPAPGVPSPGAGLRQGPGVACGVRRRAPSSDAGSAAGRAPASAGPTGAHRPGHLYSITTYQTWQQCLAHHVGL